MQKNSESGKYKIFEKQLSYKSETNLAEIELDRRNRKLENILGIPLKKRKTVLTTHTLLK